MSKTTVATLLILAVLLTGADAAYAQTPSVSISPSGNRQLSVDSRGGGVDFNVRIENLPNLSGAHFVTVQLDNTNFVWRNSQNLFNPEGIRNNLYRFTDNLTNSNDLRTGRRVVSDNYGKPTYRILWSRFSGGSGPRSKTIRFRFKFHSNRPMNERVQIRARVLDIRRNSNAPDNSNPNHSSVLRGFNAVSDDLSFTAVRPSIEMKAVGPTALPNYPDSNGQFTVKANYFNNHKRAVISLRFDGAAATSSFNVNSSGIIQTKDFEIRPSAHARFIAVTNQANRTVRYDILHNRFNNDLDDEETITFTLRIKNSARNDSNALRVRLTSASALNENGSSNSDPQPDILGTRDITYSLVSLGNPSITLNPRGDQRLFSGKDGRFSIRLQNIRTPLGGKVRLSLRTAGRNNRDAFAFMTADSGAHVQSTYYRLTDDIGSDIIERRIPTGGEVIWYFISPGVFQRQGGDNTINFTVAVRPGASIGDASRVTLFPESVRSIDSGDEFVEGGDSVIGSAHNEKAQFTIVSPPSLSIADDDDTAAEPATADIAEADRDLGTFTIRTRNLTPAMQGASQVGFFFRDQADSSGSNHNRNPGYGTLNGLNADQVAALDTDYTIQHVRPNDDSHENLEVILKAGNDIYEFRIVPLHDTIAEGDEYAVFGVRVLFRGLDQTDNGGNDIQDEANIRGALNTAADAVLIRNAPPTARIETTGGTDLTPEQDPAQFSVALVSIPTTDGVDTVGSVAVLLDMGGTDGDDISQTGDQTAESDNYSLESNFPIFNISADPTRMRILLPVNADTFTAGVENISFNLAARDGASEGDTLTFGIHEVVFLSGITNVGRVAQEDISGGPIIYKIAPSNLIAVTATDDAATEPGDGTTASNTGTFTIELSGSIPTTTRVAYTLAGTATPPGPDGTALPGSDYTLSVGAGDATLSGDGSNRFITFTGATGAPRTVTLDVTPVDDIVPMESGEMVTLSLATINDNTITITNTPDAVTIAEAAEDELPRTITVAVTDADADEPSDGTTASNTGTFTIELSGGVPINTRAAYTLAGTATPPGPDGTAPSDGDYHFTVGSGDAALSGSGSDRFITFTGATGAPGTVTLDVTPVDDTVRLESGEMVTLSLSTINDNTITITNTTDAVTIAEAAEDELPRTITVAVTDADADEPGDGTTASNTGTFTIELSGGVLINTRAAYSLAGTATPPGPGGTASSDGDYHFTVGSGEAALSGSGSDRFITFTGATGIPGTVTLVVTPVDDTVPLESGEIVTLSLSTINDNTITITNTTDAVTIAEAAEDELPRITTVTVTDAHATEPGTGLTCDTGIFAIELSADVFADTRAAYTLTGGATPPGPDGTALPGSDYTLSVGAGDATLSGDGSNRFITFTGAAGTARSVTLTVTPVDDTDRNEPDETVVLSLSTTDNSIAIVNTTQSMVIAEAVAEGGRRSAIVTATDFNATEPFIGTAASDTGAFIIDLPNGAEGRMRYALKGDAAPPGLDGTALSGSDYTLSVGAGPATLLSSTEGDRLIAFTGATEVCTSVTLIVAPLGDGFDEPAEKVVFSLSSTPTVTVIDTPQAQRTVTLRPGNLIAIVALSSTPITVVEGGRIAEATLVVRSISPLQTPFDVILTPSAESGDTATAGDDFTVGAIAATIPAGDYSTARRISVRLVDSMDNNIILDDSARETVETFTLALSSTAVSEIAVDTNNDKVAVRIGDDDGIIVRLTKDKESITEPLSGARSDDNLITFHIAFTNLPAGLAKIRINIGTPDPAVTTLPGFPDSVNPPDLENGTIAIARGVHTTYMYNAGFHFDSTYNTRQSYYIQPDDNEVDDIFNFGLSSIVIEDTIIIPAADILTPGGRFVAGATDYAVQTVRIIDAQRGRVTPSIRTGLPEPAEGGSERNNVPATLNFLIDNAPGSGIATVSFSLVGGTAVRGTLAEDGTVTPDSADYLLSVADANGEDVAVNYGVQSHTFTLPENAIISAGFIVTPIADAARETSETVLITATGVVFSDAADITTASETARITIRDYGDLPTAAVTVSSEDGDNAVVTERDTGDDLGIFTLVLANAPDGAATVAYTLTATSDIAATAFMSGADAFGPPVVNGGGTDIFTMTVAGGIATATLTVILATDQDEDDETVTLTIAGITFADIGDGTDIAGGDVRGDGILTVNDGICGRTQQVRDAVTAAAGETGCGAVTALANITNLNLSSTNITSLRADDFTGLTGLQTLNLSGNSLTSLPDGVFSGLAVLQALYLNNTGLTGLRAGVFNGLAALHTLHLHDNNGLTSLPRGVFDDILDTLGSGTTQDRGLRLDDRFRGTLSFAAATGSIDLQGSADVEVRLDKALSAAVRVPYTIMFGNNGTTDHFNDLADGTVDIAAGTTSAIVVVATAEDALIGATAALMLSTPRLIFGDSGENTSGNVVPQLAVVSGNVADTVHTLTISEGICGRTEQVRNQLAAMIGKDCAAVTSTDLNGITELNLASTNITALLADDFIRLAGLRTLDLRGNRRLTDLPGNIFDSVLDTLTTLNLDDALRGMVFFTAMDDKIEQGGTATITVMRTLPYTAVNVPYTVQFSGSSTADSADFSGLRNSTLTFTVGETRKTITVITTDTAPPGGTVTITLGTPILPADTRTPPAEGIVDPVVGVDASNNARTLTVAGDVLMRIRVFLEGALQ